jgi:NADH-quinone oxidoreductase subunit J
MTPTFAILAVITVASAVAAMSLRNLVHCALAMGVAFAGLAAFYLQLNAQFVGFAQILVYVGAVAILIVFAILLTRSGEPGETSVFSSTWFVGVAIATAVFGLLAFMIKGSRVMGYQAKPAVETTVKRIGDELMTKYILPFEVVGLLLTAALIGAVIIAMHEKEGK